MQLTEREKEILVMLGLPNKEIAQKMLIEVCTVKTHIQNIRCKLEANTRIEALSKALKTGLIQAEQIITE